MREPERRRSAIEALAEAFGGQRHDLLRGGQINASPDRHDRVRQIMAKPELPAEDVDWLLCKSLTTVGGPETFKFVLPRFLTLALEAYGGPSCLTADWRHIASRLEDASFDDWPAPQRSAIEDALALWAELRINDGLDGWVQDPAAMEMRDWVNRRRQEARP